MVPKSTKHILKLLIIQFLPDFCIVMAILAKLIKMN